MEIFDIVEHMHDKQIKIDHDRLYQIAETQSGHFTAKQALEVGMSRSTLSYHSRPGGRYWRRGPGVYRFRQYPSGQYEHVLEAWLEMHTPDAVVSHVTALEMYDICDVISDKIHITLPRSQRWRTAPNYVKLHFVKDPPLSREEQSELESMPVTGIERTLLDYVDAGGYPDQFEMGILQALTHGMTTRSMLNEAADGRSRHVRMWLRIVLSRAKVGA